MAPPADGALMSPLTAPPSGLQTPSTPRIDISCASSSTHDSGGSTPERELFFGKEQQQVSLGFQEEGAAELRSSTEELDFVEEDERQRALAAREEQERRASAPGLQRTLRRSLFKYELEAQSEKERKGSTASSSGGAVAWSDGLLPVSGRSSRLSSVGSNLSGHSSGKRSPSPHKMILETSFCGNKPIATPSLDLDSPPPESKHETELLEKALFKAGLSRTTTPQPSHVHTDTTASSSSSPTSPRSWRKTSLKEATEPSPTLVVIKPSETVRVEVDASSPPASPKVRPGRKISIPEVSAALAAKQGPHFLSTSPPSSPPPAPPTTPNISSGASPKGSSFFRTSKPVVREDEQESVSPLHPATKTPSPLPSRKSSFSSIFKKSGGEGFQQQAGGRSPESPPPLKHRSSLTNLIKEASEGIREGIRSRSKSRERSAEQRQTSPPAYTSANHKGKKETKNKSVFSALFKKKDKRKGGASSREEEEEGGGEEEEPGSSDVRGLTGAISHVEFTFNSEGEYQASGFNDLPSPDPGPAAGGPPEWRGRRVSLVGAGTAMLSDSDEGYARIQEVAETPRAASSPSPVPAFLSSSKPGPIVEPLQMTPLDEGDRLSSESEVVGVATDDAEVEEDHESKGLFQHDSFDDGELPYVPTTLPLERSVAVPIVPIRQRIMELKTCPIERPRSSTPINPCRLDDYLEGTKRPGATSESAKSPADDHKMRISLPRQESVGQKSPRRLPSKSWTDFAELGLRSPRDLRKKLREQSLEAEDVPPPYSSSVATAKPSALPEASPSPPPPLPPRMQLPPPSRSHWVDPEELPEAPKVPKKLPLPAAVTTTTSSMTVSRVTSSAAPRTVFPVDPSECQCECHEAAPALVPSSDAAASSRTALMANGDVTAPLPPRLSSSSVDVEVDVATDLSSCHSDSSLEEAGRDNSDADLEYSSLLKPTRPFEMDLDVRSNRSSIVSQDEPHSPEETSSNGN